MTDRDSARLHVNTHFMETITCPVCDARLPYSTNSFEVYNFFQTHYELAEDHSPVCPYQILYKQPCLFKGRDHFERHRQIGHVLWKCDDPHKRAEEEEEEEEDRELLSDTDTSDDEVQSDKTDDNHSDDDNLEEYHCFGVSTGSDDDGGDGGGGGGGGGGGDDGGGDGNML